MRTSRPASRAASGQLVVCDRPVDDVLDHLRYRGGRDEAPQLRMPKISDQPDVRPHVRHISTQRQQAQSGKSSYRPFFGRAKPRGDGDRSVYES